MSLLSEMIKLVVNAHDGQLDKAGKPYILHCLKVMHYLKTDDEQLQCIALGHDLCGHLLLSRLRDELHLDCAVPVGVEGDFEGRTCHLRKLPYNLEEVY